MEKENECKAKPTLERRKPDSLKESNDAILNSKKRQVALLEEEIANLLRQSQRELELLRDEVDQEYRSSEQTESQIASLQIEIHNSYSKAHKLNVDCELVEVKNRCLVEEVNELKAHRDEIKEQVQFLGSQMQGSVPFKKFQEFCCETCVRRLIAQSQVTLIH